MPEVEYSCVRYKVNSSGEQKKSGKYSVPHQLCDLSAKGPVWDTMSMKGRLMNGTPFVSGALDLCQVTLLFVEIVIAGNRKVLLTLSPINHEKEGKLLELPGVD